MIKLAQMKSMADDLQPAAKRFGLQTRFIPGDEDFVVVFEDQARGLACPLELQVDWSTSGRGAGWDNCTLLIERVDEFEVGHNGWTACVCQRVEEYDLDKDKVEALRTVERALGALGLIPLESEDNATVTFDEQFAYAFRAIKAATRTIPGVRIECRRENDVESYNFTDGGGQPYRIDFERGNAVLQVAGERVAQVPAGRPDEVAVMVRHHIAVRNVKSATNASRQVPPLR
jgi:hypothetical protein